MGALVLEVPADHPAARGHFPGNPIIPGAVLLARAVADVTAALGLELSRFTVSWAKFAAPARPGDRVDVEYSASGPKISLACTVASRSVLKAEIACDAKAISA